MPVDPSIYGGIRQFSFDPLGQAGKALAIRQAQIGIEDAQRKFSLEDDISGALTDSRGDLGKASDLLAQRGRGQAALSLRSQAATTAKSEFDTNLKRLEAMASDGIALDAAYRQALSAAGGDEAKARSAMQPVYNDIRARWAPMGVNLPAEFDPVKNLAGVGQAKEVAQYLKGLTPTTSDVGRLIRERDALPPNDPKRATYDDAIKKASTHQPATTVNLSTERKYGEQFAGKIASEDASLRDTALKAGDLADRANRVKETLASGKVITGAGADFRLALGKALNLVGGSDAETITNTETLVSGLAQNTLDAIKGSGLGAGSGFSNADRDFLEKAVGGKISLEAKTIDRLADLSHRAAEKSAQRWSKRVTEIPADALSGTGIKREPVTVAPLFKGKPVEGNPREVVLPDGRKLTFPTPAAANAFKREAGL